MKKGLICILLCAALTLCGCMQQASAAPSAEPEASEIPSEVLAPVIEEVVITPAPTSAPAPTPELTPESTPEPEVGIDPERPMLALTFDDGPRAETERLLDAFAQYGGKGTFFVVGNAIGKYESTLKRIAEEGHELGSHTWSHVELKGLSQSEIAEQIDRTAQRVYDITGVQMTTLRPPYGAYDKNLKAVAAEKGIALINWSIDTEDWKRKDGVKVYEYIMETACDGAIILCHDRHSTTVDAMEQAIPALIEQGYQLVTVTELLTYKGYTITPGEVYIGKRPR